MWFMMEKAQITYSLCERLLHVIAQPDSSSAGGSPTIVSDLIDEGIDLNEPHGNMLPLHCACISNNIIAAEILLLRGASINAYDGYRRAALHYAAERSLKCVELLLRHGAIIDAVDHTGHTPLHWAAYVNNYECVRRLLEEGANPDVLDVNLETPFSFASFKGNLETIQVLLEYNCNVDTRSTNGRSPLFRLAQTIAMGIGSTREESCLNLLLRSLGHVHFDAHNFQADFFGDRDIERRLKPYYENARELKHLCRFRIRRSVGPCHFPSTVTLLPLPVHLHSFLMLLE